MRLHLHSKDFALSALILHYALLEQCWGWGGEGKQERAGNIIYGKCGPNLESKMLHAALLKAGCFHLCGCEGEKCEVLCISALQVTSGGGSTETCCLSI